MAEVMDSAIALVPAKMSYIPMLSNYAGQIFAVVLLGWPIVELPTQLDVQSIP